MPPYPFSPPVWWLVACDDRLISSLPNAEEYYQYIITNHNNTNNTSWSPAIELSSDILQFITRIHHFDRVFLSCWFYIPLYPYKHNVLLYLYSPAIRICIVPATSKIFFRNPRNTAHYTIIYRPFCLMYRYATGFKARQWPVGPRRKNGRHLIESFKRIARDP